MAPVTERRGNTCWVHWRRPSPTVLRDTFVECVARSIPHGDWAAVYDRPQRTKGTAHQAARRALAFK